MRVYFDSSAFAKRYIDEAGTAEVLAWCERASELALSVIAVPELIWAFCRLQREGRLTEAQYQIIKSDLMADIADALICDTTPQVVQHAVKASNPTSCGAWMPSTWAPRWPALPRSSFRPTPANAAPPKVSASRWWPCDDAPSR